jgi:hypothetical protein
LFSSLIKALKQTQVPMFVFPAAWLSWSHVQCGGRPVALRPCLSAGLPLSNNWIERCKQNEPVFSGSPRSHVMVFGGLAIVAALLRGGRSMALRPRLSTGLPFRLISDYYNEVL